MGDYFDDDDLINDYMDEDLEPAPQEFDEEFLEAELGAQQAKNDTPMQIDAQETPIVEPNSEHETSSIDVPTTVTIQPAPERKPDVYSFERYQGDWRTSKKTSSTDTKNKFGGFENADRWEQAKAELLNTRHQTRPIKPSAPDAQLVELWNRKLVQNPNVVIRRSSSVSLKPIEGDESMAMTLGNGTRLHVKKSNQTKKDTKKPDLDGNILGVSMTELLRRSNAILRKAERQKVANAARSRSNISNDSHDEDVEMNEETTTSDELEDVEMKEEKPIEKINEKKVRFKETPTSSNDTKHDPDSQLWVDKHAPSKFSHLLSDERTNREVLRALRAWDPYVFRKEAPRRPTFMQKKQQESEQQTAKKDSDSSEKQTKDVRPDESHRVILLSGPPGIGKTTLAHIIARHAGYRPMEVNASDERSSTVLKDRVLRAMESSTLNLKRKDGKKDELAGRPNCIILDEVDGADAKCAIGALVEIIRAEIPAPGSKGSKNKSYLRRPIIFICNHKYSPALRPLLPFARQFDVSPPSPNRLVARLRSVLSEESLSVVGGSSVLNQLMNGTGGDIRACLYALQFAAARAREVARKKEANESQTGSASVVDISSSLKAALGGTGLKDERSDASAAITAVFRKKKEQRLGASIRRDAKSHRVEHIIQLIESFGDDSKTLDCVFTNLMNVSYVDPTLDRCTLAHEWLSSTDFCRSNHFMPAAAAAIHLLCRVETRPKLTFSNRKMVDAKYQLEANDNLAEKFIEGLAPSARGGATKGTAAIETVPYSLWMLSAGDGSFSLSRGVSSMEIMNKHERVAFDAHVSTLRSLGLTYVARDDASTRPFNDTKPVAMRLEPQIDRLTQFDDLTVPPGNRRKYVPRVLKELLAHGAAIQGMRDQESKKAAQVTPDTSPQKMYATTDKNEPSSQQKGSNKQKLGTSQLAPPAKRSKKTSAPVNFLGLGAAKAKAARTARKAALVGFDKSKRLKVSNSGSGIPFNQVVRFKYQKGFTQAVRTPCKMEDIV